MDDYTQQLGAQLVKLGFTFFIIWILNCEIRSGSLTAVKCSHFLTRSKWMAKENSKPWKLIVISRCTWQSGGQRPNMRFRGLLGYTDIRRTVVFYLRSKLQKKNNNDAKMEICYHHPKPDGRFTRSQRKVFKVSIGHVGYIKKDLC